MINLFQTDKSGSDIFEKDYSIMVVRDKEFVYGVNIPQKIKDGIVSYFRKGYLNIHSTSEKASKNRLRIRFHTAIIIALIRKAVYDLGSIDKVSIEICNDFDGHLHEMSDMIYKNLLKLIPQLSPEDIISVRFQKPSLIDNAGKAFREKNKNLLKDYISVELNIKELYNLIKK